MPTPSQKTHILHLLEVTVRTAGSHRWAEARLDDGYRDAAAVAIAKHIAWHRCDGAPSYYEAWTQRYEGGADHDPELLDCLVAFLGSESIGTPAAPASSVHLEGFVAEHIWHLLTLEDALTLGTPIRVDGPDWSVTDSGGDGLALYRGHQGLSFRLWESKAHTGAGTVRDVVNGACRQVESKALRYLARFSKVGQTVNEEEVRLFYGRLPELWRAGAAEAGGGVAVSTASSETADCFENFSQYWAFTSTDQRLGLVVVIEDFGGFASSVREHLWKGL